MVIIAISMIREIPHSPRDIFIPKKNCMVGLEAVAEVELKITRINLTKNKKL